MTTPPSDSTASAHPRPEPVASIPHGFVEEGADAPRHFVSWTCYKLDPAWRRLPEDEREAHKAELAEVLEGWGDQIIMRAFSGVGIRPDMDIMTWRATPQIELLQQSQTDIFSTMLGTYLETSYVYTGTTKPSQYLKAAEKAGFRRPRSLAVKPVDRKYFIVYPFIKQRRWYELPAEERGRMMRDHAMVGRQYPGIKLNTAFSFGMDDQEFMTAFETDSIHDFVDLMMALRHTESSWYTERDTPIFTCVHMSVPEVLDTLGGVRAAVAIQR